MLTDTRRSKSLQDNIKFGWEIRFLRGLDKQDS